MRVPSVGLTLFERQTIREGYRLAERMLRDYTDPPPSLLALPALWLASLRQAMRDLYRVIARD